MRLTSTAVPIPATMPGDRSGSSREPLFKMEHLHNVTTGNGDTRMMHKVDDDDEETSEEEDDEDTNDSGDNADTVADDDDDDDISDDDDVDEDEYWNIMHQFSKENDNGDILDLFKGYLAMYNQSKGDVLYLKIMEDVTELEASGMDFKQALSVAIDKNKEAIKLKIMNCGEKSPNEEELGIWCKFAKKRDDWDSCCK